MVICYQSDETYDLGSSTNKFRTLYLAGDTIKQVNKILKQIQMEILFLMVGTTLKKLIVDEVEIGTGTNKTF